MSAVPPHTIASDTVQVSVAGWVPVLFAGVAIVIILLFLIAIIVLLRRKERALLVSEEAQALLAEAQEHAGRIVADASAEARKVRMAIEVERTRALNEDHQSIDRLLDAYRHHLDKAMKELSYGVEKEHMRATTRFVETLQAIERRVAQNADEAKESMDSFAAQSGVLFNHLTGQIENVEKGIQHLSVALEEAAANESDKNAQIVRDEMRKIGVETARAVTDVAHGLDSALRTNIEKEFASIAGELTKYREARMRLVDEHVLKLIEETAHIALQKKLTLEEQADLVYRSLEEAKERGIFM